MSGPLSKLSRHFVENWERRVGGTPTIDGVRKMIDESVKIQHCKDFIDSAGNALRQLAIYWHDELGIIVTIDHISEKAVSVLTADLSRRKGRCNNGKHNRSVK